MMSVAISADSLTVVSVGSDNTLRIWRRETGECLRVIEEHKDYVVSVALSGEYIVSGSASRTDSTICLWNMA